MKRIRALLAVLAALLVLPGADALAARDSEEDWTVILDSDSRFLSPSRYIPQLRMDTRDQYGHFLLRMDAFSRAYKCDMYVGCMESPSQMDPSAASFEAYRERFLAQYPEALGENAVCLLYDQESSSAFVHVGASVSKNCDTAAVEEALRDPKETDSYFRMVHTLDALQKATGRQKGLLLTTADDKRVYNRLEKSLEPLRKVFSGPVFLYLSAEEDGDQARSFFDAYNTYSWTPSFYPDGIMIYYDYYTGEALVQMGEDVKLRLTDIDAVEAAFGPGRGSLDYSGFAAGVQALADHLLPGREVPAYAGPVLLGAALLVFALALTIEAAARKRGEPLLPQEVKKQPE